MTTGTTTQPQEKSAAERMKEQGQQKAGESYEQWTGKMEQGKESAGESYEQAKEKTSDISSVEVTIPQEVFFAICNWINPARLDIPIFA